MMLLAVFLSGIIVLRVLSTATAARATFLAVMIGSYFSSTAVAVFFAKRAFYYITRVIITRTKFSLRVFALTQNN